MVENLRQEKIKTHWTKKSVHGADEKAGESAQEGDSDTFYGANRQPR